MYKIILLGNTGTGKSSYLYRLTEGRPISDNTMTIGVDFKAWIYTADGPPIKVYIWDTAGQENFRAIIRGYYRDAVGALLFYDVTDPSSFRSLDYWIDDLLKRTTDQPKIVIVGHKADTGEEVPPDISELEKKYKVNLPYCRASSKTGNGVREAMELLIKAIKQDHPVSTEQVRPLTRPSHRSFWRC